MVVIYVTINCTGNKRKESLVGNWVKMNKDTSLYEEVYINDSLFIYCNNMSMGLIPFKYKIQDDSVFLYHNKKEINDRYKVVMDEKDKDQIIFKSGNETFILKRLNLIYDNFDSLFTNEEKMDTFLFEFYKRSNKEF